MTQACPRCRAPLYGPVCGMCGTRVDGQAPPPPQYAPPQPGYGQPQPGYPAPAPPPPYAAPVAGPPPSKGMAMTAGIIAIIISSIYLLIALLAIIGGAATDEEDTAGAVVGGVVFMLFGLGGVIFGVYAVKARWWACMVGGILQSVLGLLLLLAYAGLAQAEKEAGFAAELARDQIDTAKTVILVWLLISAVVAAFNFIGIASAKNYERASSRSHLRAADQF